MASYWTVSHFKRASNHNGIAFAFGDNVLFPISKEHQITTRSCNRRGESTLFPISKEHQITTLLRCPLPLSRLFPISKEHQITTYSLTKFIPSDCFPFQKSIKSQPETPDEYGQRTVSHFKRASNHNSIDLTVATTQTVSHFKRASNHNSTVSHMKS